MRYALEAIDSLTMPLLHSRSELFFDAAPAEPAGAASPSWFVLRTVLLDSDLDEHLRERSQVSGRPEADVIREALRRHLTGD